MQATVRQRGSRQLRGALFATLLAVLVFALSGCLHLNASMNISEDDRVSGELLVSTQTPDGQQPFQLRPPRDLADRVTVEPYAKDGRAGSHLSFDDLTFDEVERLADALSPADSRYNFSLQRHGSLVTANGQVDLTPLSNTDSSALVRISAPGEITDTNGQQSAGMVTWTLQSGEVTQISATFQYGGSGVAGWVVWAVVVGLGTVAVAVAVGFLALRNHLHTRASPS